MYPSISWGTWFFVSLPVCIISILLIWLLLLATFHPGRDTTLVPIRPVKDKFSGVQWFISIVTLSTIALWCGSHQLEHVFGDMGVIAIIPMVLFFGTGILNKEDFNNFLWTIIILAAGGLCLGKAVTSSGLLHTLADAIRERVEHLSLYGVLIVFSGLILVVATFISHTVAALIMLPLVRQIGVSMDDPHPNLLVMASALMCSVAMALPTSGFPNMSMLPFLLVLFKTSLTNLFPSGHHDRSPSNRPAIPAGAPLLHPRHSVQFDGIRSDCHSRLRTDVRRRTITRISGLLQNALVEGIYVLVLDKSYAMLFLLSR